MLMSYMQASASVSKTIKLRDNGGSWIGCDADTLAPLRSGNCRENMSKRKTVI